jgi:hypothetical protein
LLHQAISKTILILQGKQHWHWAITFRQIKNFIEYFSNARRDGWKNCFHRGSQCHANFIRLYNHRKAVHTETCFSQSEKSEYRWLIR